MNNIIDRLTFTIKLLSAIFVSKLSPRNHVWLVSERGTDARDNGYHFFMFLKREHPEIKVKYVISKNSPDYHKLRQFDPDLIEPRIDLNFLTMLAKCDVVAGTHAYYWVKYHKITTLLLKYLCHQKSVMLHHGIIKDIIDYYVYPKFRIDVDICGVYPEYLFKLERYNFPQGVEHYTGLCRYDNLYQFTTKRQILIMPTWRSWMWYKPETAEECEWVQKYASLLTNPHLTKMLNEKNLKLVFYPHIEAQKYMPFFRKLHVSSNIVIADANTHDVADLLKESLLLITDFSSVFFDFAYMQKPIIFYQFDEERYRKEQYQEGYFNYHNTFGDWCNNENDVCNLIIKYIDNNFALSSKQKDEINYYFHYRDKNNCKRVYEAIINS